MLIKETYHDVETITGPMRVYLISPNLPEYPKAKFPGVVVWSEIYQASAPVLRFANAIASQGYVCAVPSCFHEFAGTEALPYDVPGTDAGNKYKALKRLNAYDSDAKAAVDLLISLSNCNGRIATTGMCLGGHLAFRCALDARVLSAVCYFATDIHGETLGSTRSDSLARCQEIRGELLMIFGRSDPHVPQEGRTKIRAELQDNKVNANFCELNANHAFIRDMSSKGRFDAALSRVCFDMLLELFDRTVARDLGPKVGEAPEAEDVC